MSLNFVDVEGRTEDEWITNCTGSKCQNDLKTENVKLLNLKKKS